jgi:hypothetical protein
VEETDVIVITRDLARRFRAVARRCVSGRPRGPAPPVVAQARSGTLTLWARAGDADLTYSGPTDGEADTLVVPMAVLEGIEGSTPDPVELSVGPKLRGTARWTHHGIPQTLPFEAILPGKQHHVPESPDDWHPLPTGFLVALHECGRTAARDSARFALNRVQVKGASGQLVGTDGRQALIWAGFQFPFAEGLLVLAVPAFGSRELAGDEVRIGRTSAHLVVAIGPWRVWLPEDRSGRYPDVAAVLPRSVGGTVAGIDGRDAAALLDALPRLPGAGNADRAVTLDLDGWVIVRAKGAETGEVREVALTRSPAAGPPARVAVDRKALARALALGCRTLRVAGEGQPLVAEGDDKTFVAVGLDPSRVVEPGPGAVRVATDGRAGPTPRSHTPRRRTVVKTHETNGHPPGDKPDLPGDGPDPLAEAEALRAALAEVVARAGRLVAALKQSRRHKKALDSVMSSLRQLNLGP